MSPRNINLITFEVYVAGLNRILVEVAFHAKIMENPVILTISKIWLQPFELQSPI